MGEAQHGMRFSATFQGGFSCGLAVLLWSSWSEGLDPAHKRHFTQIPPWYQEQDRDRPSPAAGDEKVGELQQSCG